MVQTPQGYDDTLTLLDLLTWRVRVAKVEQLHDLFALCRGTALPSSLLPMLTDAGWLRQVTLGLAVPETQQPLFTWFPGDPAPAYARLRYHLRRRAQTAPHQRVSLVMATPRAVGLVGGSAGLGRQPFQLGHDLQTTAALVGHLRRDGSVCRRWLSEDLLPVQLPGLFPRKRPDAVVLTEQGALACLIEAGGAYTVQQLRHLHRAYARLGVGTRYELGVPYELW